jgi:type I restriction enzyme S subunit
MSWRVVQLSDGIHIRHGFAFKSKYFTDTGSYVVLTPGNFKEAGGFRLRPGKDRFYAGDIPEGFILGENDLIVAMTEQAPGLLGSSALIPDSGRYLHNQRLGLIDKIESNLFDKIYLYYLFNTRAVRQQISGSASGTKVRHTSPERIGRVKVAIPDTTTQRKAAQILRSYDFFIENNRRRIQLLEHAARLLYKEWFVHLRFPGHEHVKINDGVPEGWKKMRLSQMCKDIREQVHPSKLEPDTPYIGLEHMPRRSIMLWDWGLSSQVVSSKFKFLSGDILFGKIRPYFHKVGVALIDGITSSDAIVVRPCEEWLHMYVLFLLSSDEFVALASKTVREGSKMPRADWEFLISSLFLLPPRSLVDAFTITTEPMVAQLRTLAFQNRQLSRARDLLLPRLMNGEIAV